MSEVEDPWTIRVHHVGGIGEAGPLGILSKLGKVSWTVYDALEDASSDSAKNFPEYHVVTRAIGKSVEDVNFHETMAGSASSLLRPAPSAKDYTVEINRHRVQVWGVHTQVRKEIPLKVYPLDALVEAGEVPAVDFLSIDAQGAELDIINGASKQLTESTVGLVIEAEYAPLYEGQPLFCDTMARLVRDGFRLCDILNVQYFYTYPYSPEVLHDGFMTVGEVIYLKEFDTLYPAEVPRALKLAAVSAALGRLDYAVRICDVLMEKGVSINGLAEKTRVTYLRFLFELWETAKAVHQQNPPAVEANGGLGPQPQLEPAHSTTLPDPVSAVLLKYGFTKLAENHMARVASVRMCRGVTWRT